MGPTRTVKEPVKAPGAQQYPQGGGAPGDEGMGSDQSHRAAAPASGYAAAAAAGSQGGSIAQLTPADVWQLAFWSVTPPADDDEAQTRRASVRTILQALVDDITG